MLQLAGLVYGMLLSFVFSSASRNRREGRDHPRILTHVGYVLCGMSAGAAVLLPVGGAFGLIG
jgi:hypothetical protein